jgi:hypothetical protein
VPESSLNSTYAASWFRQLVTRTAKHSPDLITSSLLRCSPQRLNLGQSSSQSTVSALYLPSIYCSSVAHRFRKVLY